MYPIMISTERRNMLKTFALGFLAMAISFFVATTFVNAQTATPTPTQTPSAPSTGFGR